MATYDNNTVTQLKVLLHDRGLSVSGKKSTLIQRLQDQDRQNASVDGANVDQKASKLGDSEVEEPVLKDDSDDDRDGDFRPQGDADEEETDEEEMDEEGSDEEGTDVKDGNITAKAKATADEESDYGNATDLSYSDVEEEGDNFTEVELKDGSIERIVLSDESPEEIQEDELEKEIRGDPIYEMLNERRKLRMSIIIVTGEANAKMKNQTEFDFSDAAPTKKFPPKTLKFIPCSVGRFVPVYKNGRRKYKEMDDEEILKEESQASQKQCECEICQKRRKNNETFGEGELRSGKTRGWTKYGVGRVLGGGEASGGGGR